MVRLLREKSAYEANVFPDNNFIVSAAVFPYFYGLVGDRNQQTAAQGGPRSGYSPLAVHAFQLIQKEGPISKHRLRELLGGDISEAALDRALDELWAQLRITRVDYKPDEGVFWDVLFRWSPEAVKEGSHVSVAGSLTALVSKYLDCVLAVPQDEVEQFFSHLIGRARVREAINALQAARELSFVHVGGRVMLHSASLPVPPPPEFKPKPEVPAAPSPAGHAAGRKAAPCVQPRATAPARTPTSSLRDRMPGRNERDAQAGHRHRWSRRIGQEHDRRAPGQQARLHQSGKRRDVSRAGSEGDGAARAARRRRGTAPTGREHGGAAGAVTATAIACCWMAAMSRSAFASRT